MGPFPRSTHSSQLHPHHMPYHFPEKIECSGRPGLSTLESPRYAKLLFPMRPPPLSLAFCTVSFSLSALL